MRATAFNGSPRGRNSNSHRIIEPLLDGAREARAEVEEVFLIERNIQQCRGCFHCWGVTPGQCVLDDDMAGLLDLYLESEYVGLATPVYGMYMTGLLKNFMDRFLPLATPHIQRSDDGTFYHEGRVKRFPRQFFIVNSGFPGEHNFEVLQAFLSVAKRMNPGSVVLEVYRNCGEALQMTEGENSQVAARIARFREALRKAGREMVTRGEVSLETVEQIHLPLATDEEYMAVANRHWDDQIGQAQP
ncbi:MAG: flavodoxin family protein [Candidatus Bipolaricaulota bacterium]